MQFTPKTERQIQEERLVPEGDYDFTVIKAEDAVSKNRNPMIKVTLGLFMNDGTQRMVTDYLMEAMAHKLRHFCETVGMLKSYDQGTLNSQELQGLAGKVRVIIKEQVGYGDKNEVKDYITEERVEAKPKEETQPVEEDDIPF